LARKGVWRVRCPRPMCAALSMASPADPWKQWTTDEVTDFVGAALDCIAQRARLDWQDIYHWVQPVIPRELWDALWRNARSKDLLYGSGAGTAQPSGAVWLDERTRPRPAERATSQRGQRAAAGVSPRNAKPREYPSQPSAGEALAAQDVGARSGNDLATLAAMRSLVGATDVERSVAVSTPRGLSVERRHGAATPPMAIDDGAATEDGDEPARSPRSPRGPPSHLALPTPAESAHMRQQQQLLQQQRRQLSAASIATSRELASDAGEPRALGEDSGARRGGALRRTGANGWGAGKPSRRPESCAALPGQQPRGGLLVDFFRAPASVGSPGSPSTIGAMGEDLENSTPPRQVFALAQGASPESSRLRSMSPQSRGQMPNLGAATALRQARSVSPALRHLDRDMSNADPHTMAAARARGLVAEYAQHMDASPGPSAAGPLPTHPAPMALADVMADAEGSEALSSWLEPEATSCMSPMQVADWVRTLPSSKLDREAKKSLATHVLTRDINGDSFGALLSTGRWADLALRDEREAVTLLRLFKQQRREAALAEAARQTVARNMSTRYSKGEMLVA